MTKIAVSTLAVLVLLVTSTVQADVSKNVEKAFRGKILITEEPLPPPGETDAKTIEAYKKAQAKAIESVAGDGSNEWTFLFTAFLSKPPKVDSVSMDFFTADKAKLYVANKRFTGIDGKSTVLSSKVSISEDDGLVKGKTYVIKLTASIKGKDVSFAETKIVMK